MANSVRHRRPIRTIWIILITVAFQSGVFAQKPVALTKQQVAGIDSAIAALMKKSLAPGVSVVVAKGNNIIWEKGYGKADLENNVAARPNTVYRLASVSKALTAVAVMQLVEQGKIDLNAPIQQYVPTFPQKKYPITTRQLLGHLSGVRHYIGEDEFNTVPYKSLTEGMEVFKNDSLMHKPEAKFTYTTYGYTLLGIIVEAASGMTFVDYLKEKVYKPAGMVQSYADEPTQIIPLRSGFYDVVDGKLLNARYINSSYRWPGGGLLSSAEDMARFAMALQHGKLVKLATLQEMSTSLHTTDGTATTYGYGLIIGLPKHPDVIWHGGIQPGTTTAVGFIPAHDLSVVVLTNVGTLGGDEIAAVTDKVFGIVLGK